MSEGLELGVTLMIIGMITVFAILYLVVAGGGLLIRVVNKYYPETVSQPRVNDSKKIAVIIAAVNLITGGKGKIEEIKKIE
jgi:oxaloacetate decarboxylase gamma subunit